MNKDNLYKDVSDSREFDSLTGVYTRDAFCRHADELIKSHPDMRFNIVISDFVNFKHYNERYGSEAGDLLLMKTGQMLTNIAPGIICGRYSADRFVTIMPHIGEVAVSTLERFSLPPEAAEVLPSTNIIVKFGLCDDVDHSQPVSVSVDHAYIALEAVKHQYGKNVGIYTDILADTIHQELLIEENMKYALDNNQFHVYYQPKMNVDTGKICGAEALVRWIHPVLGFMNPGTFIPIFEKNGFITNMDIYVWRRVASDMAEWKQKGISLVPVSSNVSRKDFNVADISETIKSIVDEYGIDRNMFHLEVTESAYSEKPDIIMNNISDLNDSGFIIELDDFGSGYTSLSCLNDMKMDVLKVDMSILRSDNSVSDRSILAFVMQLARMMNVKTIQEGVETKEQLERVRSLGCNCVQGYYYSKPLPKEEFEKFLIENI